MIKETPDTIAKLAISPMMAASVMGGAAIANTPAAALSTPNARSSPS